VRRVPIRIKLAAALAIPLLAMGLVTVIEVASVAREARLVTMDRARRREAPLDARGEARQEPVDLEGGARGVARRWPAERRIGGRRAPDAVWGRHGHLRAAVAAGQRWGRARPLTSGVGATRPRLRALAAAL
jgi:hypothetical protein